MHSSSIYDHGLGKNDANYAPLTPLGFLARAAAVFPDHPAVIHGGQRFSYRELYTRCRRLASALAQNGAGSMSTISVMLLNTPPMIEAHYGVPMCRAVLHSLNTRLDASAIAFQLDHAESSHLIFDREFAGVIAEALKICQTRPKLIEYSDENSLLDQMSSAGDLNLPAIDYEAFIAEGDGDFAWLWPEDEWDAISLNYTSGTTGNPKGVVYHHRGAYLLAQGNVLTTAMGRHPVYLWTLPMFHCNGWCFPWSISVAAGTHICLRAVRAGPIWQALDELKVTHLCGAPIVMDIILNATAAEKRYLGDRKIEFLTAAAPPPEAVLAAMGKAGFQVTHLYGLTETYGPAVVNEWQASWNEMTAEQQAVMNARQGVRYLPLEGLSVRDPQTMQAVKSDGQALGEVMFRGNVVMKGYLKNTQASEAAFAGGWFHSGDLGVMHLDGYIQLKDRSKDIIISGGENISSIEIENILYKHEKIGGAAVVAFPDDKWGETPCAFIECKAGQLLSKEEVLAHCRAHLAGYKMPGHIVFSTLPRTSTGKIQKFLLRKQAQDMAL